ncbi:lysophospholipase [Synechococcus sp. PCC 6716]|nr:lysophospholipase [Synechococcus sp. PCC 6716]
MNSRNFWWHHPWRMVGVALVLLGGLLWGWFYPHALQTELVRIPRQPHQVLVSRLYLPLTGTPPYPTLMLWHGVNCTKETMEPLAVEMARHGIATIATDVGGFGESYPRPYSESENDADASVVMNYVAAHPDRFDPQRLGVGGHSMGGAIALSLASTDSRIVSTLNLGMSSDINPLLPPNLFMGSGLYEQFHTPTMMRAMLRQGTIPTAVANQTYGDLSQGRGRKLVISATSDHGIGTIDVTLLPAAVAWATATLAPSTTLQGMVMPWVLLGQCCVMVGSWLLSSYLGQGIPPLPFGKRGLSLACIAGIVSILLLAHTHLVPPRLASDGTVWGAIALPLANYGQRFPAAIDQLWRVVCIYTLLVVSVTTVTSVVWQLPEWVTQPQLLLGVPFFFGQQPLTAVHATFNLLRSVFFVSYSDVVIPRWPFLLVVIPELVQPSSIIQGLTLAATAVGERIRQPLVLDLRLGLSKRMLYILAALVLVLVLLLYQQVMSGVFTPEFIASALKALGQSFLIPLLLMVVIVRSPFWQRWVG